MQLKTNETVMLVDRNQALNTMEAFTEYALLGAILLDNSILDDLLPSGVGPAVTMRQAAEECLRDLERGPAWSKGTLGTERSRCIWKAMHELRVHGQAIDLVTLVDRLHSNGDIERAGGIAFLASLLDLHDQWAKACSAVQ